MTDAEAEASASLKASLKVGTATSSSGSDSVLFLVPANFGEAPLFTHCGLGGDWLGQAGGDLP